jgi:hypothetical protein
MAAALSIGFGPGRISASMSVRPKKYAHNPATLAAAELMLVRCV